MIVLSIPFFERVAVHLVLSVPTQTHPTPPPPHTHTHTHLQGLTCKYLVVAYGSLR